MQETALTLDDLEVLRVSRAISKKHYAQAKSALDKGMTVAYKHRAKRPTEKRPVHFVVTAIHITY